MTGVNVNAKEIFRKFGLQVREIEPVVYEILNTSKEVSIDELQWELEECVLITSDRIRSRKLESGIYTTIAYVYYIILDYDSDVCYEYDNIRKGRIRWKTIPRYQIWRRQESLNLAV